jgi:hypothetical protein
MNPGPAVLRRGLAPVIADNWRETHPMCAKKTPIADGDKCDVCKQRVAIYVEKRRRRGKLTRDQLCAGCLQTWYGRHGLGPEDLKRR